MGERIDGLDGVRISAMGELASEGIDRRSEGRDGGVANRRGQVTDRGEVTPVPRLEHRPGRRLAVVAAENVGILAEAHSREVRARGRQMPHNLARATGGQRLNLVGRRDGAAAQ